MSVFSVSVSVSSVSVFGHRFLCPPLALSRPHLSRAELGMGAATAVLVDDEHPHRRRHRPYALPFPPSAAFPASPSPSSAGAGHAPRAGPGRPRRSWTCLAGCRSATPTSPGDPLLRCFQNPKNQRERDRKSTRLNSSHITRSRMPSSA